MKRIALLLTVAAALVFAPSGAFAKDKKKKDKKDKDRHECRDDDRRYSYEREHQHSNDDARYYSSDRRSDYGYQQRYSEQRYYPAYRNEYRSDYRERDCDSRRSSSGGVRFVFGF